MSVPSLRDVQGLFLPRLLHHLLSIFFFFLEGAVRSHGVHLIHSARPSDLRGGIRTFQAVTEPVGDQSNSIVRLHPVRAAGHFLRRIREDAFMPVGV